MAPIRCGIDEPRVDEQPGRVLDVADLVAVVVEADVPVGAAGRVGQPRGRAAARVAKAAGRELHDRVAIAGPLVAGRSEVLLVVGAARPSSHSRGSGRSADSRRRSRSRRRRKDHVQGQRRAVKALQARVGAPLELKSPWQTRTPSDWVVQVIGLPLTVSPPSTLDTSADAAARQREQRGNGHRQGPASPPHARDSTRRLRIAVRQAIQPISRRRPKTRSKASSSP